ncbi:MAG: hypothetical protein ACI9VR_004459 [Cognaticolwellia sp.]|jgi:hypothetical protein
MSILPLLALSGGLGIVGVRSSSGAHRIHPSAQFVLHQDAGKLVFQGELLASTWQEDVLEQGQRSLYLRPAVLAGLSFGEQARVGFYTGPAVVFMNAQGDLSRDLGDKTLISGTMGWTQRGRSGDVDLGLTVGVRW